MLEDEVAEAKGPNRVGLLRRQSSIPTDINLKRFQTSAWAREHSL